MAHYDASTLVNAAYSQVTGQTAVTALSIEDIIDQGVSSSLFENSAEQFTKALIEVCTKWLFTDGMFAEGSDDPYYVDEQRFGSITSIISIEAPEVKENSAWQTFTSGTSKVGQYTVVIPQIENRLYSKLSSWALPITITKEQWDPACPDAAHLEQLVDFIIVAVENAITQHRMDMNNANRNTFMAAKCAAQAAVGNTGIHVIELRAAYNAARGKSIATKEAFLADPDAMRWASKTIMLYKDYIMQQSVKFNTAGKVKFVPRDRLVLEVNTGFLYSLEEVALSGTFHDDMVALDGFRKVPYWQAESDADSALDFTATTTISVKFDKDTTVTQSGIVAFMADKYAILHTIKKQRVAVTEFPIENLTYTEYQFVDAYMNNLDLPAIVFTLEDPA